MDELNYTIQVVEFFPHDLHGILIRDDATGDYLTQGEYEAWIEMIGGYQKRKF